VLVVIDVALALLTYFVVFELRFDFSVPTRYWDEFRIFLPVACAVQVLATWAFGCYGRSWRHASIDEARRLLSAGLTTMVVLVAAFSWGDERVPFTVVFAGPVLVTLLYGLVRFQSRLFAFRRFGDPDDAGVRIVVVGAGGTGSAALRELRHNPELGLVPVAVVDDDPSLQGRRVHEIPVAGTLAELGRVIDDHEVHQVLFAIPSAPAGTLRAVAEVATTKQIPVRVIRAASSWVNGMARLRDLRDLEIEDLLGRQAVDIDLDPVRELIQGKRVLVTGGGGWIGAEIVRQVAAFDPASLVLLDHDETHLHDARQGVDGPARIALCDIRDVSALDVVFAAERPEVVFHAAAHKHVSILEDHPCEAIRTNVLGTANVVDVCTRFDVSHLVCISTDKAAVPTGVMAASKWVAEQIVLARAPRDAAWCSVRFGNVLASRGSVIPLFQRQIADGGPVTVTDARMTRYFMSTDEAVQLVMLAAAATTGHHVLALEMGEQVNIYELAERMIRLCGYQPGIDIPIEITGMLPGEKLSEAVIGPSERRREDEEGPILTIETQPVAPDVLADALDRLEALALANDRAAARAALLDIAAPALRRLRTEDSSVPTT
jgi:FlaA1/EpsC-like NDP-sugar epimerase